MFAFGDEKWPGLAKLAEEAGEVVQVVGKLMMTHGDVMHWDGSDLEYRLLNEMADLAAAIDFVVGNQSRDQRSNFRDRREEKLRLFQSWHREPVAVPK